MDTKVTYLVYVVDDDATYVERLKQHLHRMIPAFLRVRSFSTPEECLEHHDKRPHMIFLENSPQHKVPGKGLQVLKKVKRTYAGIPVVVLTRNSNIGSVVRSMRSGAYSYILKNQEAYSQIENLVTHMIAKARVKHYAREEHKNKLNRWMLALLLIFIAALFAYSSL